MEECVFVTISPPMSYELCVFYQVFGVNACAPFLSGCGQIVKKKNL